MALISLRQLLDHASENNYGVPAFNVNNLEQIRAIMEGANEVNSPVIVHPLPINLKTISKLQQFLVGKAVHPKVIFTKL